MAASRVEVEIERKYDLDGDPTVPDLVGVAGGGVTVARASAAREDLLDATYLDTAGLALARQAIALRRRRGGRDAGWHLKGPAEEGRTERQWPLEDSDESQGAVGSASPPAAGDPETENSRAGSAVPPAVQQAVAEITGGDRLVELARITNRRVTIDLIDTAGAVVAEVVDDHVDSLDHRSDTSRSWREWEVELGVAGPATPAGRAALLDAIQVRLAVVGAHPSASSSKLARALGADELG